MSDLQDYTNDADLSIKLLNLFKVGVISLHCPQLSSDPQPPLPPKTAKRKPFHVSWFLLRRTKHTADLRVGSWVGTEEFLKDESIEGNSTITHKYGLPPNYANQRFREVAFLDCMCSCSGDWMCGSCLTRMILEASAAMNFAAASASWCVKVLTCVCKERQERVARESDE